MGADTKISFGNNPEKAAESLASVRLTPVAKQGHLTIEASVKFGIPHFLSGEYEVFVGLKEATLRLFHPAFDTSDRYHAAVDQKHYHESFTKDLNTEKFATGELGAKLNLFKYFSAGASAKVGIEQKNKDSAASQSEYLIVTAEPQDTWRIGSKLGDPRRAAGSFHKGVAHCLHGEYLHGTGTEEGRGCESRPGKKALCRLDPKPRLGANDKRIIGSVYGAPGSLQVGLERRRDLPAKSDPTVADREKELRQNIIQICIDRAAKADHAGPAIDQRFDGEFYLASDAKLSDVSAFETA